MAQSTFSVRMDEQLKEQFSDLCESFGMNMSTAINVFARAVVRERKIPFEISAGKSDITRAGAIAAFNEVRAKAVEDGLSDMSLEEINAEIDSARRGK
jgi:DNA-damage-inducible protein J